MNSAVNSLSRFASVNNSLSVNKVILSLFLSLSFETSFSTFSSLTTSSDSSIDSSSVSVVSFSSSETSSSSFESSVKISSSSRTSVFSSTSSILGAISSFSLTSLVSEVLTSFLKVISSSSSELILILTIGSVVLVPETILLSKLLEDVTLVSSDFKSSIPFSSLSLPLLNRDFRLSIIDIENTPWIIIGI